VLGLPVLKLGCAGCLTVVLLGAFVLGVGWCVVQIMRAPEIDRPTTPADSLQAQKKIFEFLSRARDRRQQALSLSEPELNAFLGRNLATGDDLPLRNLAIHLRTDNHADIRVQIALRELLALPPLSALTAFVPGRWLDHGLWLTLRARAAVERTGSESRSRRLRLDVERFWLGRLPLPEVVLRLLVDPGALRLLRSPIPETIDGIRIESGRLFVYGPM
jgi:hypothetical protein